MTGAILNTLLLVATLSCQQNEASGDVVSALPLRPTPVPTADADVRAAQVELSEGRAWLATRRLAPVLRTAQRRSPEAVLVAARSAAAWRGWGEVDRLLENEPWLASRFGGEGLELLARSSLERGEAAEARSHAEAALRVSNEPAERAVRLVVLARALDRLDIRDSAAATYRRAATAVPLAREWLLLRAAGITSDAGSRQKLYSGVSSNVARARIPFTEAQALERFNELPAAAVAYEKVGDMPSAFRLRLAAATDDAERVRVRTALLQYIQRRDVSGDRLQRAITVLDTAFPDLHVPAELSVARRTATAIPARAAAGFSKVPAAQLTDDDVITWARALMASRRSGEAATRISQRRFAPARAAEAGYVRGHALVRAGSGTEARRALQGVVTSHAGTKYAGDALYLLADLESDAGREAGARDLLHRACRHTPAGTYGDNSCFRAGILSLATGDARRAAATFDEISKRFPGSPELLASVYWAGRAWDRIGNAAVARERWQAVMQREPLSYYALLSSKRLGRPAWSPNRSELSPSGEMQDAMDRAAVLEHLGMDVEERFEYDAVERDTASVNATLAAGAALLDRGQVTRAIRLGWRAIGSARVANDSANIQRGYALVYPLLRRDQLLAQARANKLDPALVAALIRQESSWFPRALSPAGARGLMQVMPAVGRQIAQSRSYPIWDPVLLFDPDVSLELGSAHLRAGLSEHSNLQRALAAYNAGGSRVRRWVQRTGANDPELFVERIPFVETRDYVRIVMRNAELYRAMYDLSG